MPNPLKKIWKLSLIILLYYSVGLYMSCRPWTDCIMFNDIVATPNDTTLAEVNKYKIDIGFSYWFKSCKTKNSLINSAYAYKPARRTIAPEKIEYLHITSNQDFDANHPAGSLLNDVFNVPTDIDRPYEDSDYPRSVLVTAALIVSPAVPAMHSFKIEAKLEGSGIRLDTILKPIMVQ